MEKLACLEQLYISNNGIEVLENLEENGSLTTIDLASNRISQLDNLQSLQNVEEFWFNDNLVCRSVRSPWGGPNQKPRVLLGGFHPQPGGLGRKGALGIRYWCKTCV